MEQVSLGDRQKSYEEITNYKLVPRCPICIRIDGNSFSRLTKKTLKLSGAFNEEFSKCMAEATAKMAGEIQGCMLGYTQSDEITLIIKTDQGEKTEVWFGGRIQKITSIVASGITTNFMRALLKNIKRPDHIKEEKWPPEIKFDCRIFNVPNMVEAYNNVLWRQRDCVKNSISSAAYYEISKKCGRGTTRKMLDKLNQNERQELLFQETGINWANYPETFKNGVIVSPKNIEVKTEYGPIIRRRWVYEGAPIFTSDEGKKWLWEILNIVGEK